MEDKLIFYVTGGKNLVIFEGIRGKIWLPDQNMEPWAFIYVYTYNTYGSI
jgi:hypothetical protein